MKIVKFNTMQGAHYAIRWSFWFYKVYLDLTEDTKEKWYFRSSLCFKYCISRDLRLVITRYSLFDNSETVLDLTEVEKLILGE
jgi:hypothetical protein